MHLVLYQPDIPQNTGTILRLAACLGVGVAVIGPTGFDMSHRALRRAGLDYIEKIEINRHVDWAAFLAHHRHQDHKTGRLILLTTRADHSYLDFAFRPGDKLLLGRESAGVPDHVHQQVDERLTIPMRPGFRSLNIAVAAAMVLAEALRQTSGFDHANCLGRV